MKRLFGLIFALVTVAQAVCQNIITYEHNLPCAGDEVVKQQIMYTDHGSSGENVFWNFCDIPIVKPEYKICYSGNSILTAITPDAIYRYSANEDTLRFIGFENPLIIMDYSNPTTVIKYPLAYGDSLSCSFDGTGKYCNIYDIRREGQVFHEVDATGSMSLTEGDTLKNVIRIHSVKTCVIRMATDSIYVDTLKDVKQEIEELYTWYARGYRYPVFETLSRTFYNDMTQISTYQTAFRCLPEEQRNLSDSINENIIRNDSIYNSSQNRHNAMVARTVSVRGGGEIVISYDMESSAHITFIVAGSSGMLYRKKEIDCDKGMCYSTTIDCGGLRSGEYILYINVNETIDSEKIIL